MAVDFGRPNNGNYYRASFGAPISISGDFAVGFWVRLDSNAGQLFQYLFSTAPASTSNSLNLYTIESSFTTPGLRDKWHAAVRDSANSIVYGDAHQMDGALAVGDGVEKLVIFQRRAGRIAYHICERGGVPVTSGGNPSSSHIINMSGVWFGIRADNDAGRRFKEKAGQLFILDRSLSDAEIEHLATGSVDVRSVADAGEIIGYWQLEDAGAVAQDLSGNERHLSRYGSPVTADFTFVAAPAEEPVQPVPVALGAAVSSPAIRQRHRVRPAAITLGMGVADAVAVQRHRAAPEAVALSVAVSSTRAGGGGGVEPAPVSLRVDVTSPAVMARSSARASDIALQATVAGLHGGSPLVSQRHTVGPAGLRCGVSISSPGASVRSVVRPAPVHLVASASGARAVHIHRVAPASLSLGMVVASHVPYTPAMSRGAHAMAGRGGAAPAARRARAVRF